MAAITSLRELPAVDTLIAAADEAQLPRSLIVDIARTALDISRRQIETEGLADPMVAFKDLLSVMVLNRTTRVINATGVLLHTNMGRAPLSQGALAAMSESAAHYSNLELIRASGERGGRDKYLRDLLCSLTGAEAALVVNNNAAGLLLALAATSAGKSVPVARGELIEIGGSYRLPDVMTASGATLVEVGTTNRTRIGDFATAIQLHRTGAILKVHPSNYRIEGFTSEVSVADLSQLAEQSDIPLIHDVGSGLLDSDARWLIETDVTWIRDEPAVKRSLDDGASLVTFSGDKLLGGPQAGIVVGKGEIVTRMADHPLARALRIDGPRGAALAATLESYAAGSVDDIPFWNMAHINTVTLTNRAEAIQSVIGGEIVAGESLIGAGSVPGTGIPSPLLVLAGEGGLYVPLLRCRRPVATRRNQGDLIIDLRSVEEEDDEIVADMVTGCRS